MLASHKNLVVGESLLLGPSYQMKQLLLAMLVKDRLNSVAVHVVTRITSQGLCVQL